MRITNNTANKIAINDIDRGHSGMTPGVYEESNAKVDTVIAAGSFIDVPDTDKVKMSKAAGNIKKFSDLGYVTTAFSLTGKNVETFTFTVLNNSFVVNCLAADQAFTFAPGAYSANDVVSLINATASGFTASVSPRFFRNAAPVMSGFIALSGPNALAIKSGSANTVLGFTQGDFTQVK